MKVDLIYKPEHEAIVKNRFDEGVLAEHIRKYLQTEKQPDGIEARIEPNATGVQIEIKGYDETKGGMQGSRGIAGPIRYGAVL